MTAVRLIPKRIEGRHVLIALLAFFGVMLLANGIFLYYALGTFNGFETSQAYRKGLTYNTRIAADKIQTSRGWQPVARYEDDKGRLVVEVRDERGRTISGLIVSGEIRRPVTDAADQPVILTEVEPARYAVPVKLAAGQWILAAEMTGPEASNEAIFRFKQRLWVKGAP